MNTSPFRTMLRQRGIGLIELMVAIVIGAVVCLAVFGVVSSFEGRKRTITSVNDMYQSGSYALYRVDKWLRSAGSGFSYFMDDGKSSRRFPFGCELNATHATKGQLLPRAAALPAPFDTVNTGVANVFRLTPVLIVPGGTVPGVSGKPSDVLLVMAGTAGNAAVPVSLDKPVVGASISLRNTIGYGTNDLLLLADQGLGPAGPCFIEQVGTATTDTITTAGDYHPTSFGSGKTPTSFANGTLVNLGSVWPKGAPTKSNPPHFVVIGVGDNNTLFSYDLLKTNTDTNAEDEAASPIADGVFEMHALYGVDTDSDNKVDTWVSPSDATSEYTLAKLSNVAVEPDVVAQRINNIKAVRVGVILRTSLAEKGVVAPAKLALFEDLGPAKTYTRVLQPAEQTFRYRTLESTIPVRNTLISK
jgi:type IV pilus assembly protein PilW